MMRHPQRKISFGHQKGFALPMAIIAISGMLLILVGLLAVIALERKSARSYADATRAEFALQSGLADAIATISPVATRDDSLVFRVDDVSQQNVIVPITTAQRYFTFGSTYDVGKKTWQIVPFFSGMKEINHLMQEHATSSNNPPSSVKSISDLLEDLSLVAFSPVISSGRDEPRAAWIDLNHSTSNYRTRFAWWVEDLSGRIDGKNAGSQPRAASIDPRETGLYTLFHPESDQLIPSGPASILVAKNDALRSSASVRTVLPSADAEKVEPWITYSLPEQIRYAPLIPHGFGYLDAGQPAQNLNELIAQRNVDRIAQHLDRNLPQWNTTRKGGFPASENYTKTLAASIIDYSDADSDATIGTGYRGVDSYPFVNEVFDRYEWRGTSNGNVIIRVSSYIEIWNLSQQNISGTMIFENQNRHTIQIPPASLQAFTPVIFPPQLVSLAPNDFKVIECGFRDYQFPTGAFPPSSLNFPSDTITSSYRLTWNGGLVDWARGGATRTSGSLRAGASNAKWKGNASPAHDHGIGQHGDPRASYYINAKIFPNNYDKNSNWGGRAVKPTISNPNYNEVSLLRWPDRGWQSRTGTVPGSDARLPTTLPFPPNQPTMAPAFIANTTLLQSVAELGNIFDPAQWSNVELSTSAISSSAGGGFTLAIGRPELGAFDKEGFRAAQLLDLFHIPPTDPSSYVPKMNINTAPREALRTLIAGQALTLDPNQSPLFPPKRSEVADRFADAVIATRTRGPMRGLSDLNLIRLNPDTPRNYASPSESNEPFFGSRLQYPLSNRPDDQWDDAGREELFRRISNLVTFQSKTFRIVVAGEVLDRAGIVVGRRSREFHVQLEPARNANLTIDPSKPMQIKTVYSRSL